MFLGLSDVLYIIYLIDFLTSLTDVNYKNLQSTILKVCVGLVANYVMLTVSDANQFGNSECLTDFIWYRKFIRKIASWNITINECIMRFNEDKCKILSFVVFSCDVLSKWKNHINFSKYIYDCKVHKFFY